MLQFLRVAPQALVSTVLANQPESRVHLGPVLEDGEAVAFHIHEASFQPLSKSTVQYLFSNTTIYCAGRLQLAIDARQAAVTGTPFIDATGATYSPPSSSPQAAAPASSDASSPDLSSEQVQANADSSPAAQDPGDRENVILIAALCAASAGAPHPATMRVMPQMPLVELLHISPITYR